MNWLITGGCGFIGTNLVSDLLEAGGHGVRVLDDLSVGTRADLAAASADVAEVEGAPAGPPAEGRVELVVGSILDADLVLASAAGVDAIVHLAGNTGVQPSIADPRGDCLANVVGTLNVLEAARHQGVPRFVFASSGGTVIGDCEPPIHEELVPKPKSPYGASKSACEGYLSAYHGSFGVQTVALRFGNVYGPRSRHKSSVVASFVRRALDGASLEIYGDGAQTRDFVYVADLIAAVRAAATADGVGGHVVQIASGAETTVNELAQRIVPALTEAGVPSPRVIHAAPLPGEIRRNYSDTRRAAQLLGWAPTVDLDEGLRRTLAWFLSQRAQAH